MRRWICAAVTAVSAMAISLFTTPAASAAPHTPVGLTVTGTYTGILVNGLQVSATCDAVSIGAVSATVIDNCYLTASGINHPSTLPGNVTGSAFVERVGTVDFQLCFSAYAIPIDDPTHPVSASGCSQGLPSGLAGTGAAISST